MILTFCGYNFTLLQVTNALPHEMEAIKLAVTETVPAFRRKKGSNWSGEVCLCWWIEPYFYIPAGCWNRIMKLREPDIQNYRPAYEVEFRCQDKFFNKSITYEEVETFVNSLNPAYDDVSEQINVLRTIIMYRLSCHNIATGFGKTYLSYILAQYTHKVLQGPTLMIVPRIGLVEQGIANFNEYMETIDDDMKLKCFGICSGFRNNCRFDEATMYIGTYQSVSVMPDDMFEHIKTVICDEGHTAKALSVRECIIKCKNAEIITAISGTMLYSSPVDRLTIEQYCGPMVTNYPAIEQINKGRLPRIAIQQVVLKHTEGLDFYKILLQEKRLPMPGRTKSGSASYEPSLASSYRSVEFEMLWSNQHLMNYILKLAKTYTDMDKNVLVIFKNRQPAVNCFELARSAGMKSHLIFGSTPRDVRRDIINQIEHENGFVISATDGVMSLGVSINNLHTLIVCMIGHSPHVVLQGIGRMLRKHPEKFSTTICYDIINDFSAIGTNFDLSNGNEREHYYKTEQHQVFPKQFRTDIDY